MKYILLLLLFTPPALALEVILDRSNHIGLRTTDILIKKSSHYIFNGKDLGSNLPPDILKSFNELTNLPPDSNKTKRQCASGSFIYIKKEGKNELRQTGCTEGPTYGQMIENIETLRKFSNRK